MAHQFVTVFILGLSNAAAVIVANTIGEGKKEAAVEYAFTIGFFSIAMGMIAGIIIYLIRPVVVNLYNVTDATKMIAMEIMKITSIIVVFQSLGVNMMMGVLSGGGDAKFVLVNDIIFMWLVAIPGGFLAAFVFKLPIVIVFFIIKSDEVLKSIVSIFRFTSGKWVKDVTRDFEEIEAI